LSATSPSSQPTAPCRVPTNSSVDKTTFIHPFIFQMLTKCSSRNPFVLIFMQIGGGVWGGAPNIPSSKPANLPTLPALSPFFSHSCALFCVHQNHNSFIFKHFRTLCPKHPGVGYPPTAHRAGSLRFEEGGGDHDSNSRGHPRVSALESCATRGRADLNELTFTKEQSRCPRGRQLAPRGGKERGNSRELRFSFCYPQ
jgi:hypothetical protein